MSTTELEGHFLQTRSVNQVGGFRRIVQDYTFKLCNASPSPLEKSVVVDFGEDFEYVCLRFSVRCKLYFQFGFRVLTPPVQYVRSGRYLCLMSRPDLRWALMNFFSAEEVRVFTTGFLLVE